MQAVTMQEVCFIAERFPDHHGPQWTAAISMRRPREEGGVWVLEAGRGGGGGGGGTPRGCS